MIDPQIVAAQASRTNLTPALIWAVGQQKGVFGKDQFANEIAARQIANALSAQVEQHGSIEAALSALQTGDPNAHNSPTNPAAGYVAGVLGLAGSQPTYGLDHFTPANPDGYAEHFADLHEVFNGLAELGGVVTHEGVATLAHAVQKHLAPEVPSAPAAKAERKPIIPAGPDPSHVAEFQQHASSLGIDPEHFIQHYAFAASMNRKLAGKPLSLDDYAPMSLMDRSQIQQHLRAQPHPAYPEITAGQYHDAYAVASLHSWKAGYMPHATEAANFAALGTNPKEISQYYQDQADAKAKKAGETTQPTIQTTQAKPAPTDKPAADQPSVKANG